MAEQAFKPIFIDLLHYARLAQDTFLQELSAEERATSGTPEYWSAKDHIAHMTFWRQRLVLKLTAILLHQEVSPEIEEFERFNEQIFEEQQQRSWSSILAESKQAYTELITLTEQFTDEDLTAFKRFNWHPDGEPLYAAFLGNCYEHTQQHLAQYYLDRHNPERARQIYEVWAQRAIEVDWRWPIADHEAISALCMVDYQQ